MLPKKKKIPRSDRKKTLYKLKKRKEKKCVTVSNFKESIFRFLAHFYQGPQYRFQKEFLILNPQSPSFVNGLKSCGSIGSSFMPIDKSFFFLKPRIAMYVYVLGQQRKKEPTQRRHNGTFDEFYYCLKFAYNQKKLVKS